MLRQEARMALQATCHRAADEEAREGSVGTRAVGKALPYLRKRLPSPPPHASEARRQAARRLVRASRRAVRSFTTAASSGDS